MSSSPALPRSSCRDVLATDLRAISCEVIVLEDFRTGHKHPHFRTDVANYGIILKALGRSDAEVQQTLQALQAEHGVTLK